MASTGDQHAGQAHLALLKRGIREGRVSWRTQLSQGCWRQQALATRTDQGGSDLQRAVQEQAVPTPSTPDEPSPLPPSWQEGEGGGATVHTGCLSLAGQARDRMCWGYSPGRARGIASDIGYWGAYKWGVCAWFHSLQVSGDMAGCVGCVAGWAR